MKHKDGFPETYHILPTPLEVIKAIGSFAHRLCNQVQYAPEHSSNHFVPFQEEPNYWKQAESLYEDGATSPSVMDTFEQ